MVWVVVLGLVALGVLVGQVPWLLFFHWLWKHRAQLSILAELSREVDRWIAAGKERKIGV